MNKIRKTPKKATITITLILVCIFLLACTCENKATISESTDDNNSIITDKQIWDMALEIYEGLKNKDKDRIKLVFSENQLMNHSRKIDRNIDKIYEFIDGEIVEYEKITGSFGGGEQRYYEWIDRYFDGYINGIKTDTGREYTISYGGCMIDKNDSDNIGVFYFKIWEKDSDGDESILVGTYN